MLILKVLSSGRANGYEIAKQLEGRSAEALQVDHGSLYPALRRLEQNGWIEAKLEISPTKRQARYYSLTAAGEAQIGIEQERWESAVLAVARVMA
jgi:PadR family transcriptional regulator, regulatory protein PadR